MEGGPHGLALGLVASTSQLLERQGRAIDSKRSEERATERSRLGHHSVQRWHTSPMAQRQCWEWRKG
eukprot:3542389-Rhodomonas_salina.1